VFQFLHALLLACCLVLAQLAFVPQSFADGDAETREKAAQLEQLRKRISKLKDQLKDVRGTRDAQQAALEKTDKAISQIAAAMRVTRIQLKGSEKQLRVLEKDRQSEQRKLAAMRTLLIKEIRASYMAGRQERIKLLLNQEDPASFGRMLVYQGYFTRTRESRMREYNDVLARLQQTEQSLRGKRSDLEALRGAQQAQSEALAAEQARQRELLVQIERQLGDKSAELKTLQQDEQRLGKLVESLRRALRDLPMGKLDRPFKMMKGKLAWPVTGKIAQRYGDGKTRSRGVLIATRPDADVHAIAKGRVAFADWLRGFGLLMIIEHGDGYMSLYGRNNSLYKGVGEWVEYGEVVAAAGSSGGQRQSGLYLELRKDGRPIDPGGWFRGKPGSQAASRD
jgi:septal ring factor EnvC (AmiA/AmiB activator)